MPGTFRILLVEDNPDDRALALWELARQLPEAAVEDTGDEAALARALEAGGFDVVVTDYHLGWTEAPAVLGLVRSRWPDCPVVVFTGTGSEVTAVEAMRAGADDYVTKSPSQVPRLAHAIRSALERARERRAREDAEARYRGLVEGVPVGLVRTTPTGEILEANPAALAMFGYPPGTPRDTVRSTELYVEPEDRRRWQRLIEQEGVVRGFEIQVRRLDGRVIWVAHTVRVVRGDDGAVLYYEGALEDVTERRRAVETARALEEAGRALSQGLDADQVRQRIADGLRTLLHAAGAALFRADPGSAALVLLAGSGDTVPAAAGPALFPEGTGLVGVALREGRVVATGDLLADPRVSLTAAARAWVEETQLRAAVAAPLRASGEVVGVLAVADRAGRVFDAEDVRTAEAFADLAAVALQNARLHEAVRGTADFLRSVVDNSADAIVTTDVRGRVTYFSPAAEEIFGYAPADVLGRPVADFYVGGVEEARGVMRRLRAGEPVRNWETAFRAKDGHVVEMSSSVSLLRDGHGEVVGTVGVIKDVTELRRAAEEIQRQRERLVQREKIAAMGELLGGVAHELNNPLSVVLGQAALLARVAGEGPTAERARKISEAAERCGRIVRNFLAMARQYPPERYQVSLNHLVQEAVELLAYPLRVDGVSVTLELAPGLPTLWADGHQLQQVLVNLLTNAHQAMREVPGPRRLAITTAAWPDRTGVRLEVADSGPGIPDGVRARVFEPFFTTKPAGQGTGLGLSLCRGIVEGHGGTLDVESQPGAGATFRVDLPVGARPHAAAAPPAPEAPAPARGRILVVDDEAEVRELLSELLAAEGHEVDLATDGTEALERLAAGRYDAIVSDVRMPGLDGPGLYGEIQRRWPDLCRRFVFVTGDTLGPQTQRAVEEAGTAMLGKPFVFDEVRRTIRRVLGAGPPP